MAAESWVTIGGFTATTVSAIAAFFAVKQSMLQRTILTKPQIIISNQEVKLIHLSDSIFRFKLEHSNLYHYIPIIIKNVGLGTALKIKYNWSFDYKKTIELCEFKSTTEDPINSIMKKEYKTGNKYYHITDEMDCSYNYFKFVRYGRFDIHAIKKEHNELEYVMPIAQEKSAATIEFPSLILMLLSESAYSETVSDEAMFDAMNAGRLNLIYEDISGNKITVRFNCTIRWIRFEHNAEHEPCSTYRIEFQRVHSEPKSGLRRIRKSYAKVMNEHYLNKNR